ncbi:EEF1A lysine methyltransferase 2 isoform X2 [Hypomesus transpacificus]|uniref:EEF1A lysine methyltransferase 2 isoform X2 n=1 Tax=Hypomesus transpacificus TaxID=137520 RepID=UPI001F075B53|nr:EEF1A lysine methyltransferase 2 isoform X2 [Hypomesus transpacificus]
MESEDFKPSKLGTKEYWDDAYERELQTFKDIGDVGEIWFGEESMTRVLRWIDRENIPENAAILDIGTGNGILLVELAKQGFTNLTGIDYSTASVELAKRVLQTQDINNVTIKDTEEGKAGYIQALREALKNQGLFSITSCNWTKEQLLQMFSEGFEFVQELPTPSYQFGGRTGNNVTAVIFKRLH